MINIPNDLRKNKDKIIGNMDMRECTCLFFGILFAIIFLYYFRIVLGYKRIVILSFIGGIIVLPFIFFGFKKIRGMRVDDYIKVFVNNNLISRPVRINRNNMQDEIIKDKKYELIRIYKLADNKVLIKLREHLINLKVLLLTEYISYKGDTYVVFRINCRDMVKLQEKRNSEEIKIKISEIKEKKNNIHKKGITLEEKQELKKEIKELKYIKKKLMKKKLVDFKLEVDIFEKCGTYDVIELNDIKISELKEKISNDDRNIYELNLFDKSALKKFLNADIENDNIENRNAIDNDRFNNGIDAEHIIDKNNNNNNCIDRIVFVLNDGRADIFIYDTIDLIKNAKDQIVDLLSIDKKLGLYDSIKLCEARDFYNIYRSVNSIEDIL